MCVLNVWTVSLKCQMSCISALGVCKVCKHIVYNAPTEDAVVMSVLRLTRGPWDQKIQHLQSIVFSFHKMVMSCTGNNSSSKEFYCFKMIWADAVHKLVLCLISPHALTPGQMSALK